MRHFFISRPPFFIDAIGVVQFGRAVHAQSHQKSILCQELAPFVVEQRAVGLESVGNLFSVRMFFLQCDDLAKKLHAKQRWLTALPGKGNLGNVLLG